MTFIVLKFSFLAIKGEMDRKDEKSHYRQKTSVVHSELPNCR